MKFPLFLPVLLMFGFPTFSQHKIAITIDDLPYHTNYRSSSEEKYNQTKKLLHAAKSVVHLTGFVNEIKLYQSGALDSMAVATLELWLQDGHELGNHTYSHMDYNTADSLGFLNDILKGAAITQPFVKNMIYHSDTSVILISTEAPQELKFCC